MPDVDSSPSDTGGVVGSAPPTILLFLALYVFAALFKRRLQEAYVLLRRSNYVKCTLFDFFQEMIYFRPFKDEDTVLSLDGCDGDTLKRRRAGFADLCQDLQKLEHLHCANTQLVDCRFKKVKVLFPLLKELERKYPNRVESVEDDGCTVVCSAAPGEKTHKMLYLSLDAVRVFGKQFYEQVHLEAQKRFAQSAVNSIAITQNPEMEKNMGLWQTLTGMQKFRYTLSGSEAVDACLKDVRLSTGKKYIVRFKSAYHGHTTGVDALSALGENHKMIYLKELDEETLLFLEEYHYLIAGVIVNPMMFFTGPNAMSPPGEKMTMGKRSRTLPTRQEYADWLHALNEKCKYCTKYLTPMAFILDDIYFAFRTPELFSFQYFRSKTNQPLDPDQIILGKGVAAGLPLSVICGKKAFAMNYDPDYLLKINKVVGTLSAYPMGIVSSNVFLEKFVTPEQLKKLPIGTSSSAGSPSRSNTSSTSNGDSPASTTASSDEDIMGAKKQKIEDNIRNSLGIEEDSPRPALVETISTAELRTANGKFDLFTKEVNAAFEKEKIPLKLRNFANTFTLDFKCDSLYNSMFVQHLIANNVFVTNQSTGKFNLLLDWTTAKHDGERKQLLTAFVTAGRQMKERGFFVEKKKMQFFLLAKKFLFSYLRICYDQIMEDKRIDIEVSHNHPVNKFTHFWSSVFMILFAYTYIGYFGWYKEGFLVFLITHVLRQAGHFFYEKQDRNYEKLKFGHKDGSKKAAAVGIAAAIYVFVYLKSILVSINTTLGTWRNFVWLYRVSFLPFMMERLGYWGGLEEARKNYRILEQNPTEFQFCSLSDEQFVVLSGLFTIVPHFADIVHEFGWVRGWEWFLKILTDPFTDLLDFYEHWIIHPKEFLDLKKQFGVYELDYETKKVKDCEQVVGETEAKKRV